MTPVRPATVSATATPVMPDASVVGAGVQAGYIAYVQSQDAAVNAKNDILFRRALSDWEQNAQQCQAYNLRVPPQPVQPPKLVPKVVFAQMDGTVVPNGAPGSQYVAWIDEVWAGEVYGEA